MSLRDAEGGEAIHLYLLPVIAEISPSFVIASGAIPQPYVIARRRRRRSNPFLFGKYSDVPILWQDFLRWIASKICDFLAMTNKNQAYYVLKSSQKTSFAFAREVFGRLLILEQLQHRLRGL